MKNRTLTTNRNREKTERRRRVTARYGQLITRKPPKEAIQILSEEEAKSPKTIYSILEGWR